MDIIEESQITTLDFTYNANGLLIGLHAEGKEYFYIRNLIGEIIKVIDEEGNDVVKYEYTAFGKPTKKIVENCVASIHNSFMYKGYYYDEETGLYWISSRYYNPQWCRWISPDDVDYLDPKSINGLNLYCYCMNNPIMYADPSGHFPWLIIPVILLVAVFAKGHKTNLKEEDININGTSSGKVKIKITENNIEIESSYRYGHEDMVFILNTIKNHELYKKYNYNRDIESYLAEWKAHNFAYYVMPFGEIGKQTRNVNLDRNEDQDVFKDWYWIFRLF